ncbi:uncharacterized protein [Ovis canadensis]|uniref:uncharacterized protein n=1 Tax=Ovis canadensis TaxID=37174 RepID=UPI003751720B
MGDVKTQKGTREKRGAVGWGETRPNSLNLIQAHLSFTGPKKPRKDNKNPSSRPTPPPGVPAPFSSSEAAIFRPRRIASCASAATRYPVLQPTPPPQARPRKGGPGLSLRERQLRRHEGPAPTPPAVPERLQLAPAGGSRRATRGPDRLHWAERPWRRLGPEGSIALTSCFGSGHFGRTRMEAPKNTRMEEAATGKSGCSWSERALRATGNGATAAPRPQSPHAPPPGLFSLGLALRAGCCVTSGQVGAPKRVSGYWSFGLSQSRGCCLLFSLPHSRKFKY